MDEALITKIKGEFSWELRKLSYDLSSSTMDMIKSALDRALANIKEEEDGGSHH